MESSKNISHGGTKKSLEDNVREIEARIREKGDTEFATVDEKLTVLHELAKIGIGKQWIVSKGFDGYWTDYVCRVAPSLTEFESDLERQILRHTPSLTSIQEHFHFHQTVLQSMVEEGVCFASVPSGVMNDLLTLDWRGCKDVKLIGVDIDGHSLDLARENAKKLHMETVCEFDQGDAWDLHLPEKADAIVSSGLSFYEADDERVIELFKQFKNNLKPNGLLITNFLTPPPAKDDIGEWFLDRFDFNDFKLSSIIFTDILGDHSNWSHYRSSEKTTSQLKAAGFTRITIEPHSYNMTPTVLAR